MKTSRGVMELGEKHGGDLTISREVYGVIYEGRTARDAYLGLSRRPGAEDAPDWKMHMPSGMGVAADK